MTSRLETSREETSREEGRTVVVDQRLAARRREIRRQTGRRRLRRLQVGLGVAGMGGAAWALALSPLLDVDRVSVGGAERTDADVVKEATGIDAGEAMLTLRPGDAERDVESLPWVATASVARHWPGAVRVTITERRPMAVVAAGGGGWVVVDGEGRQLAVADASAFRELPRIIGLEPVPQPGAALNHEAGPALEVTGLLAGAVPGSGAQVVVTAAGLELALPREAGPPDTGTQRAGEEVRVRLGDAFRLSDKIDALAALIDAGVLAEPGAPLAVDVRVPDAPVLTRAGG